MRGMRHCADELTILAVLVVVSNSVQWKAAGVKVCSRQVIPVDAGGRE